MPMIRALTLHVASRDLKFGEAIRLLEDFKRSAEAGGVQVWTLRISLGEDFDWRDLVDHCGSGVLIAAYHRRAGEVEPGELAEYLARCGSGYATVLASEEDLDVLPELYAGLAKSLSEDHFTRLGVIYGSYLQTPYFPASAALSDAVSVAYRYADLLLSTDPSGWVDAIRGLAGRVDSLLGDRAREVGLEVHHDLSLSPWMSESAVGVVEKLGAAFPRVGTLAAVRRVNGILLEASGGVRTTGYNELMLPVAEDERLKRLVEAGELRLEDLIAFSTACVAGLDMVAVPRDPDYLRRLFADTYAAFSIKKRPYGVRVIPTDKPVVRLSRFGELPAFMPTGRP